MRGGVVGGLVPCCELGRGASTSISSSLGLGVSTTGLVTLSKSTRLRSSLSLVDAGGKFGGGPFGGGGDACGDVFGRGGVGGGRFTGVGAEGANSSVREALAFPAPLRPKFNTAAGREPSPADDRSRRIV